MRWALVPAMACVAVCAYSGPRGVAAAVCPPTAMLKGDSSAVAVVEDILSRCGIATVEQRGCPLAEVVIDRRDGELMVEIKDPSGRWTRREVVDYESAASVIESWVRSDLTASMLTPSRAVPSPQESDPESLPAPTSEAIGELNPAPPGAMALIDLGFEIGVGFDGSAWFGGMLAGCAVLGRACLGATARVSSNPAVGGDSALLETRRLRFDILANIDFSFFFDRVSLRPGIDAGALYIRMAKVDNEDGYKELIEDEQWNFACGAHLSGALELGRRFSFVIAISATVLPFADTAPFREDDTEVAGSLRGIVGFALGLEYGL